MMIIKLILKKQIINKKLEKKLCMIVDIFILKNYVY